MPADGDLVSLRLLRDRREELTSQRTEAGCPLHRLLAELTACRTRARAGRASTAASPRDTASAVRENGTVYHCYSSYSRGTEFLMGCYAILGRVPKGRGQGDQPMSWLRRRDEYESE